MLNKWWFDELYNFVFVQPTLWISRCIAGFDKHVIDRGIDGLAWLTRRVADVWDAVVDRGIVDGLFNSVGNRTWDIGLALRAVQTGKLRQYVLFIVVGTVALFVLISMVRNFAIAG